MNNKPDKALLMAYLYGEISDSQRIEIENWLRENPAMETELKELRNTQNILAQWTESPVEMPLFIPAARERKEARFLLNRSQMLLAAAISFILLALYLAPIKMSYSQNELSLQFGGYLEKQVEVVSEEAPSEEDIQPSLRLQMQTSQDSLNLRLSRLEKNLSQFERITESLGLRLNTIPTEVQLDEATRNQLLEDLQKANLKSMLRILEASELQQKRYTEDLLIAYAEYLEERRKEDLNTIGLSFTALQEKQRQEQHNRDQVLTQLVNTLNKK